MLLLNLGGPETLEDVQPFLYNLFADPDIIRLPSYAKFLQPVVAQVALDHDWRMESRHERLNADQSHRPSSPHGLPSQGAAKYQHSTIH